MLLANVSRPLLAAVVLAFAGLTSGCAVEAEAPVVYEGYEPVYYDGYVVYYDTGGLPYYYMDGSVVYVPRSYVHYDVLVDHYRVYRPYYHRWYVSGGYRYKRYHAAGPSRVYRPASPGAGHHAPYHHAPTHHAPSPSHHAPHRAPSHPHHGGHGGHRR